MSGKYKKGMKIAGKRFATLISCFSSMFMPIPIISSPPTALISITTLSLSSGAIKFPSRAIAPWYTNTGTTESITPIPSVLAKRIDAVYSAYPEREPDAIKYSEITFLEILEKDLKVMDGTAASLCRDNGIPIHVFALSEPGNMMKAVMGEPIGTIIKG